MEQVYVIRSFTVRGIDGNDLRISETMERDQVVVAIQQNDDGGRMATVRLTAAQLRAFGDVQYSLRWKVEDK